MKGLKYFNRILPFRDLRSKPWSDIGKRAGFKALQVSIGLRLLLSPRLFIRISSSISHAQSTCLPNTSVNLPW